MWYILVHVHQLGVWKRVERYQHSTQRHQQKGLRKMPTTEITTAQDFIFDNMHIRIWLGEDGTIWYCAKDVAVALGYTNTSKAVKDHCKGVTKRYPPSDRRWHTDIHVHQAQ